MSAISPFSLIEKLSPGGVVNAIGSAVAETGKDKDGLLGAFSDVWNGLDANDDGVLGVGDVVKHATNARDAVFTGVANAFGIEKDTGASATANTSAQATAATATIGTDHDHDRGKIMQAAASALERARTPSNPAVEMLIAASQHAWPSSSAVRTIESLPGISEIRAAYATARHATARHAG